MNQIRVDPERIAGAIDRNIFGGFAEHLGRCIYGGIFEPASPLADERGLRRDVLAALRRLRMPLIRYPGGNFVSGYRWRDGVGPERPSRLELAWGAVESNRFGTDEFVAFCHALGSQPYLTVNCGDGDAREARDWVEYCNGTRDTALTQMRRDNGCPQPHQVKYWGIGNEVDGPWQIGFKTPQEYARAYTEFAKVMRWTDPDIRLVASLTSAWGGDWVERAQLLLEQAPELIDYLAVHWYVANKENDFAAYMANAETFETRLAAVEGIIRAMTQSRGIQRPIHIAVDEWNVWYRTGAKEGLEEVYTLEDALMTGLQLNAFIRHAATVRMANLAQIVNVIAPIITGPDGLVLQTIFHPFELYSRACGETALDVWWSVDTFACGGQTGLRILDVAATLDTSARQLVLFVVNRSADKAAETRVSLTGGTLGETANATVISAPDVKTANTFATPEAVSPRQAPLRVRGDGFTYTFEPRSVTAVVCSLS